MNEPQGYVALDLIGFTDRGEYDPAATYVQNDIVGYNGSKWKCLTDDTTGKTPAENANWTLYGNFSGIMQGATASQDGVVGLVTKPKAGDQTKSLRGDGSWEYTAKPVTTDPGVGGQLPTGNLMVVHDNGDVKKLYVGIDNKASEVLIGGGGGGGGADWATIRGLVRAGQGASVYPVGTQFVIPHKVFGDMIFDVIGHDHDKNPSDANAHTMTLQLHYAIYGEDYGYEYSANECMYVCQSDLQPGTYYLVVDIDSGWNMEAGSYQFTTTKIIPAGGQIVFKNMGSGTVTQILTFASPNEDEPIETIQKVSGSSGTNLGTLTRVGGDNSHNNLMRAYGSDNYAESTIRQWLNSTAFDGWFNSPGPFARRNFFGEPLSYLNKPGFLNGFSSDFLSVLGTVEKPCKTNAVYDRRSGANQIYTVTDKVFLLSAEEVGFIDFTDHYDCGTVYGYYYDSSATSIKYDMDNVTNPVNWAIRGSSNPNTRDNAPAKAGYITTNRNWAWDNTVNRKFGIAPACVIY